MNAFQRFKQLSLSQMVNQLLKIPFQRFKIIIINANDQLLKNSVK